jgi:hypothetical protein
MKTSRKLSWVLLPLGMAMLLGATSALADGFKRPAPLLPLYTEECGSCHLVYPPELLSATSWKNMMGTLNKHYGVDASLEDASTETIQLWLEKYAGRGKYARSNPPEDRITQAAWFQKKHRKINAVVWKHESVLSKSNCSACHKHAAKGDFEEENLTIPRGLPLRYQTPWQED